MFESFGIIVEYNPRDEYQATYHFMLDGRHIYCAYSQAYAMKANREKPTVLELIAKVLAECEDYVLNYHGRN